MSTGHSICRFYPLPLQCCMKLQCMDVLLGNGCDDAQCSGTGSVDPGSIDTATED